MDESRGGTSLEGRRAALPKVDVTSASRNRILASLGEPSLLRLLPSLEPVALHMKDVFYEVDERIDYVHFVLSGVASLVASTDDESGPIEVATVGNEGMVGLPAFLGTERSPMRAFVQVPGQALRMSVEKFRECCASDGDMTGVLMRYTQALITQIAQSSACNRLHSIEERCARWLLMTHDRVATDEFPLTQEFLSQMLGVRRGTVNATARTLQQQGLITYVRGVIAIFDRKGLEGTACECYEIVRREFARLLEDAAGA